MFQGLKGRFLNVSEACFINNLRSKCLSEYLRGNILIRNLIYLLSYVLYLINMGFSSSMRRWLCLERETLIIQYIYKNRIPSILGEIEIVANDLITSLQKNCGLIDDETLFDLRVIINEVLINAILHGNKQDASKLVKIDAGLTDDGSAVFIIEDEGLGYDFNEICRKHKTYITNPADLAESGRGMTIVKGLCEKVKVNSKGNKVVIVKRIGNAYQLMKHV